MEHLPYKHEDLSSNPSTPAKKKKWTQERKNSQTVISPVAALSDKGNPSFVRQKKTSSQRGQPI
jgi:hypothetical protein